MAAAATVAFAGAGLMRDLAHRRVRTRRAAALIAMLPGIAPRKP
jgi:hypothetical protein